MVEIRYAMCDGCFHVTVMVSLFYVCVRVRHFLHICSFFPSFISFILSFIKLFFFHSVSIFLSHSCMSIRNFKWIIKSTKWTEWNTIRMPGKWSNSSLLSYFALNSVSCIVLTEKTFDRLFYSPICINSNRANDIEPRKLCFPLKRKHDTVSLED